MPSFILIHPTVWSKNHENWLIFDRVIQKNKKVATFSDRMYRSSKISKVLSSLFVTIFRATHTAIAIIHKSDI